MMDLYRYDLLEVTPQITNAVEHLLSSPNVEELPPMLRKELLQWKECETGIKFSPGVTCDCPRVITFSLMRQIREELKKIDKNSPYLWEIITDSRNVFPRRCDPPRNPELVARLEKIQASLDNAEYKKMVQGAATKEAELMQDLRLDVQATHRQLWTLFNFLLTVVGSFVFGYFAGYYAGMDTLTCVMIGLTMGLAVFFADVYFIIKYL